MLSRRRFIATSVIAAGGAASALAYYKGSSYPKTVSSNAPLKMPPLIDATRDLEFQLLAKAGTTNFFANQATHTLGFNQSYLGPVIRVKNGSLRPHVQNSLSWPVSTHWHGLVVPGEHDGGPHTAINSGSSWQPEMQIAQDPCTAFFHTHIHGRTARDVYAGLAGVIHVIDGKDEQRGLPNDYGNDDLTIVLQDREFTDTGQFNYSNSMMSMMHGMTGDQILINGQLGATAVVPKSVVRLRFVNASNARIYRLFSSDDRPMHLIATDGGFLKKPAAISKLILSPGERAEVLMDFSNGIETTLLSSGDPNEGMAGMFGRALTSFEDVTGFRNFQVLPFSIDDRKSAKIFSIPSDIGGEEPQLHTAKIDRTRRFSLDMGMGSGMMSGRMGNQFSINGEPFDMGKINERVKRSVVERWVISTNMLAHPFHIHGTLFQVIQEGNRQPSPENSGWKDTVLVNDEVELLVRFDHIANDDNPYMYHCHLLEHEDAGMMGQFTVS